MERMIGPHRIVIEDDILFVHPGGPFQLAAMIDFLALCDETYKRLGSAYTVTLINPGYALPPESRKYISEWSTTHTVTGTVIVNAPFAMRALISILARATQLMGAMNPTVHFVADEAEARAWIAADRERRRAAGR